MSLISCPECGKEISDKAVSCPNCGNPINPQKQEEYLCCPYCGSRELHAEHKGFSGGKALAGYAVTGGIGLLAGTIGSHDTQITCLKCGKNFKAGEAKVVNPNDIPTGIDAQIIAIAEKGGKMGATVWYKNNHKCSMTEAKNYVDSVLSRYHFVAQPSTASTGQGCMSVIMLAIISTISLLTILS